MSLDKLHVLVTRPKPQGEILCKKIEELGGRAIYLPTIEIAPSDNPLLFEKQIKALDQYNVIIFVSPHAVLQSQSTIHQYWPQIPEHIKFVAVGLGTARELQAAHLPMNLFPSENWSSEGILNLPEFREIKGQKIAIICGQSGRELLAATLVEREAEVTLIFAYQRLVPKVATKQQIDLFSSGAVDTIVCTSKDSLQNLLVQVGDVNVPLVQEITILVVSERIADFAKEHGFKKIIIATNASHESILDALLKQKRILYGT